jgi:hypothetical protein
MIAQSAPEFIPGLIAQTHKALKKRRQNRLNPFQRVFAMSLGIHAEVDCDSNHEFNRSIFQSPGVLVVGSIGSMGLWVCQDRSGKGDRTGPIGDRAFGFGDLQS